MLNKLNQIIIEILAGRLDQLDSELINPSEVFDKSVDEQILSNEKIRGILKHTHELEKIIWKLRVCYSLQLFLLNGTISKDSEIWAEALKYIDEYNNKTKPEIIIEDIDFPDLDDWSDDENNS